MRKVLALATLAGFMGMIPASAMTYAVIPYAGASALLAQGQIGASEASRFLGAMEQARAVGASPHTLVISSPGGNLGGAVELGLVLRQLGLRTVVGSLRRDATGHLALGPGGCHSACVMALMAGVQRTVTPGSTVSVHGPQAVIVSGGYAYNLDPELNHRVVQRATPTLRAYARQMGVNPALIDLANRVPNSSARRLSSAELESFGITGAPVQQKQPGRKSQRQGHRA